MNLPFPHARGSASLSPPDLGEPERIIDVHRIVSIVRRRLKLALALAILVFIGSVVVTLRTTPLYTATASVMIDSRKEQVVDSESVLSGLTPDTATVDSEVEILKSRQLAGRVVASLHLDRDPEFNAALRKPGVLASFKATILELFHSSGPAPAPSPEQAAMRAQRVQEAVVDAVRDRLSIQRVALTYVMNVGFRSDNPVKAARIANAYADHYLLEQLEAKFDATRQANAWLNTRLAELRAEVIRNEAAVERFRAANNLLSTSGQTLTEQEISTYNQQLATVRAQQAEDEARLRTARAQLAAGSTGEDVGEALNSVVIQQLRSRRSEVSGRIADMSSRYGPRHPDMLRAQGELQDIDTQIRAEIGRIISNLEAKVQVSRERTASMSGSLAGARGTLAGNNNAGVRLNELVRNAEASKTLYEGLLDRFKQTTTQAGLEQSDARIVSRAVIPGGPSSPNVPMNLLIGLILALATGGLAILIAELFDTGLATAQDVERKLGLPHLGSIPLVSSVAERADRSKAPIDYLIHRPLSAFAEALRAMRTSIQFSRIDQRVKSIVITSSLPGEGKTTTAVALACSSAQAGQRAIIVDCDLRRRAVNRVLHIEPQVGLLEVLNGQATLDEAVLTDASSGAFVLPLAHSSFTPKDVFQSEAMRRLIAHLKDHFDLVIFDTAPVLAVAETRVLAAQADAVVFLARWRKTPDKAIENALKLLDQANAHIAGVALVQMDMRAQSRYGYGDQGYYYGAYKKYYAG